MQSSTFKVGETVLWSGGWGSDPEKLARITGVGEKNGRIVFDLDNGHWAYSEQLRHYKRIVASNSEFDEAECGGAFDGFHVTSDADPGL